MNDIKCECKDNKIYYVLAGGGLVLLTYLIKNNKYSYQQSTLQQSNLQPEQKINDSQKINELENSINLLKKQLSDQTESIQRYQRYKNLEPKTPHVLTVQEMNDTKENTKRRFMFNMI